jgi:hypothetical protein
MTAAIPYRPTRGCCRSHCVARHCTLADSTGHALCTAEIVASCTKNHKRRQEVGTDMPLRRGGTGKGSSVWYRGWQIMKLSDNAYRALLAHGKPTDRLEGSSKEGVKKQIDVDKRSNAADRRARLHRALDAVMDAATVRWRGSPAPTGKYSTFEKRAWPTAVYSNGDTAITLYADKPYSKQNAEDGTVSIKINVADHSVGKTEEGRAKYGGFTWRTLATRANTLKQAKQLGEGFISRHPEYAP